MSLPLPTISSPPPTRLSQRSLVATKRKLGFPLLALPQFGPLYFSSWPTSRCGGPPSCNRPRSGLSFSLTTPLVSLSRQSLTIGRGLRSKLLLASIQGIVRALAQSELQGSWPDLMLLLNHGCSFIVNPRPDWSVSGVALSMRVWSRFACLNPYATKYHLKIRCKSYLQSTLRLLISWLMHSNLSSILMVTGCATGFIVLSLPYYSFDKRLQPSSHWERSLPPSSFVKERTFPSSWLSSRDQVISFVLARIHSTFETAVEALIDVLGLVFVTDLGGKRCLSTSMSLSMTRQFLWGFNTTTLPTHLEFVFRFDVFLFGEPIPFLIACLWYVFSKFRGRLIPSFICKTQG